MLSLRAFIKSRTTRGIRAALWDVRREWSVLGKHRGGLKRAAVYRGQHGLKLHLGSGNNYRQGWVNIDLFSPVSDLKLDLREPLPFQDGSAAIIYSEHFFEHLAYPDEIKLHLAESLRVLEPGGCFSVGVPDMGACLMAYANNDAEAFRIARERWHPAWCNTWMHQVNYGFRQGKEHKYAYDFETLAKVLTEAGFVNASRRPWKAELDNPAWQGQTYVLYVDAQKPGGDSGHTNAVQSRT